jgi:hypothetical protein
MAQDPSIDLLRTLVRYEDGTLYWLSRTPDHFKRPGYAEAWNRMYADRAVGLSVKKRGGHTTFKVNLPDEHHEVFVHRAVWALVHGSWPKHQIDHIDRDPSNNCAENLRDVSGSVNQTNKRVTGAVPYFGVRFRPRTGNYEARVKKDGKQHYVGTFPTAILAAKARDRAAVLLHGEDVTLNFPQNFSPM